MRWGNLLGIGPKRAATTSLAVEVQEIRVVFRSKTATTLLLLSQIVRIWYTEKTEVYRGIYNAFIIKQMKVK